MVALRRRDWGWLYVWRTEQNQQRIKAKTCVMFYYFHFEMKYARGTGEFVSSITFKHHATG
jgi:hypothetical protein